MTSINPCINVRQQGINTWKTKSEVDSVRLSPLQSCPETHFYIHVAEIICTTLNTANHIIPWVPDILNIRRSRLPRTLRVRLGQREHLATRLLTSIWSQFSRRRRPPARRQPLHALRVKESVKRRCPQLPPPLKRREVARENECPCHLPVWDAEANILNAMGLCHAQDVPQTVLNAFMYAAGEGLKGRGGVLVQPLNPRRLPQRHQ